MAKRIILMYISEISGHHSATLAIEEAIKARSKDAQIMNINAFNYTNPVSEKIINRLYLGVIKTAPKVWDYLYDNPDIVKKLEKIKQAIHKFNLPKLKILFDKFKPDAVLCAQAFPCGMVADYKKSFDSDIPLIGVLTDYVPHSYWIYDTVNYYITPNEEISCRLTDKGVDAFKVKALGIPFALKFNENIPKEDARVRLGLDKDISTILIMGGGQGLGPVKTIVESLERTGRELQEIVVTGTNKKLYDSLSEEIKRYKKKILVFGYSSRIDEFMSASDIIITKPGGITTAEALSKKLAMIIVKPIPGQEANNTKFLIEKQAAIRIDDVKNIDSAVDELLSDRDRLENMSQSAGKISKPNASMDIAEFTLGLIDG